MLALIMICRNLALYRPVQTRVETRRALLNIILLLPPRALSCNAFPYPLLLWVLLAFDPCSKFPGLRNVPGKIIIPSLVIILIIESDATVMRWTMFPPKQSPHMNPTNLNATVLIAMPLMIETTNHDPVVHTSLCWTRNRHRKDYLLVLTAVNQLVLGPRVASIRP